jgi:hypothetical protein
LGSIPVGSEFPPTNSSENNLEKKFVCLKAWLEPK